MSVTRFNATKLTITFDGPAPLTAGGLMGFEIDDGGGFLTEDSVAQVTTNSWRLTYGGGVPISFPWQYLSPWTGPVPPQALNPTEGTILYPESGSV